MENKYLPIGSIVLLENATKKLMITGFGVIPNEEKEKLYDYSGVIYPEGLLRTEHTAVFNHSQIKEIVHIGYSNEEEIRFKEKLNRALKNNDIEMLQ